MGNAAGVGGVLAALFRPGLIVPHIVAPDINSLDWQALHQRGVSHVLFDKDNCLTLPHAPDIIEEVRSGWEGCRKTFERGHVLIVSNSAGSSDDPLSIEAEQLAKTLDANVLAHPHKKPSSRCAKQIVDLLSAPLEGGAGAGHVLVVGDRVTTDIILASRIDRCLRSRGGEQRAIGVLTTRVFGRERLGTRLMRWTEMSVLARLQRLGIVPGAGWRGSPSAQEAAELATWAGCIKSEQPPPPLAEVGPEGLAASTTTLTYRARIWVLLEKGFNWIAQGWNLLMDGIALGTKSLSLISPDRPRKAQSSLSPSSFSLLSTSTSSIRRRLIEQSSSALLPPRQNRLYSSKTRNGPPPLPPSPRRAPASAASGLQQQQVPRKKSNWPAALAALVLMPTCWFGGVYLHDVINGDPLDNLAKVPNTEKPRAPAVPSPPPANPAAATNIIGPKQDVSLLTARLHLERELASIEAKLDQQYRLHPAHQREQQQR